MAKCRGLQHCCEMKWGDTVKDTVVLLHQHAFICTFDFVITNLPSFKVNRSRCCSALWSLSLNSPSCSTSAMSTCGNSLARRSFISCTWPFSATRCNAEWPPCRVGRRGGSKFNRALQLFLVGCQFSHLSLLCKRDTVNVREVQNLLLVTLLSYCLQKFHGLRLIACPQFGVGTLQSSVKKKWMLIITTSN